MRLINYIKKYQDGGGYMSLSVPERKKYITNWLVQRGYSPVQVAAIVGNLQQENSSFDPSIKNQIGATGIAQWYKDRRDNLFKKPNPLHIDTQLEYLHEELQGSGWTNKAGGKNAFFNTTDLNQATYIFRKDFERPGEHEANDSNRVRYASEAMSLIDPNYKFTPQQTNDRKVTEGSSSTFNHRPELSEADIWEIYNNQPSVFEEFNKVREEIEKEKQKEAEQNQKEDIQRQQLLAAQQQKEQFMSLLTEQSNPNELYNNTIAQIPPQQPQAPFRFQSDWFSPQMAQEGGTISPPQRTEQKFQIGGILEKLNPKNWGVSDYSDKKDFNTAYSTARKEGLTEFMYNGKRYNTDYAGTPTQQLEETGITNEQIQNRSNLNKNLTENIYPYSYNNLEKRIWTAGVIGKKEENRKAIDKDPRPYDNEKIDALNLYAGIPQKNNTFKISKYKPSKSSDNINYYTFNKQDDKFVQNLIDYAIAKSKGDKDFDIGIKGLLGDQEKNVMGNYKMSTGKDGRGAYVSFYDKWDLSPVDFGKPFEIYDRIYVKDYGDGKPKRMYYSDKELSQLSTDKKNFDTLALQIELNNRGYKLPNSTKEDGTFDGILGEETKEALKKEQIRLNRYKQGGQIPIPQIPPPPQMAQEGGEIELPTATVNPLQASNKFLIDYINSPNYRQRLTNSGYKDVENVIQQRSDNVADVKLKKIQYERPGFFERIKMSLYGEPYTTVGSVYKGKDNSIILDQQESEFLEVPLTDVWTHETGHSELNPVPLNEYDTKVITDILIIDPYTNLHGSNPKEIKSDLNVLRYHLYKNNIVDPKTQQIKKEDLDKLDSSFIKERLLETVGEENLIWLLNNIALNTPNTTNQYTA